VGIEATGHTRWFERLLAELGHELWVGDAARIRAAEVPKQKTDVRDAALLLEDLNYVFDADGRISSVQSLNNHVSLPAAANAGTADANNRLSQFGTNTFSYDDEGQIVNVAAGQNTTSYQWDARGRLIGANLPNGSTVQYGYDAMGRLASRSINGQTSKYVYSGSSLLLRRDSSGAALDFVNGTTGPEKLLQSGVGGDLYFLQDHLSSVIALANGMGSVVEQESYEPFGNTQGSGLTDYGYIGGRFDPDTRLLFLNSRFYDPASQRFITEDPIGVAGGLNIFAYAGNDPVNLFDPSGMSADNSDYVYQSEMAIVHAGDKLSFGLTNWIRDQLGTNDVVDKCSFGYQVGGYVGDAINLPVIADVADASTLSTLSRILGQLAPSAPGLAGDVVIGNTAVSNAMTLITADTNFAASMVEAGYENLVRLLIMR